MAAIFPSINYLILIILLQCTQAFSKLAPVVLPPGLHTRMESSSLECRQPRNLLLASRRHKVMKYSFSDSTTQDYKFYDSSRRFVDEAAMLKRPMWQETEVNLLPTVRNLGPQCSSPQENKFSQQPYEVGSRSLSQLSLQIRPSLS